MSLSPNLIAAPSMASPYIVTRQSFQGREGRSWQLTSRTSDLARAKPTLACNLRHHQCPLPKFKFTKPCLTRLLAFFPTPTPPKPHSTCPPYSKQALASPSFLPICSPLCTAPPSPGLPPPPARAWEHSASFPIQYQDQFCLLRASIIKRWTTSLLGAPTHLAHTSGK